MRTVGVLGVPSSAGARRPGQGRAPGAFRRAALLEQLRSAGLAVRDYGDLPEARYTPDPASPQAQNVPLVREVASHVATRIADIVRDQATPLVLGGDCTLTLGVVAGMVREDARLRLVYFDGDADLKTPQDSTSGILDGMGLAHLVGQGVDELSHLGPRYPMLGSNDILLFGYNRESRWFGTVERERLQESSILAYPVAQLKGCVADVARAALAEFDRPDTRLLVHFDVDVIDFDDLPVADVPHYGGLTFSEAFQGLEVFVHSPNFAGLVITEFNVDRDPDGAHMRRLVTAIVHTLKSNVSTWA
jgi:arginase